MSHLRTLLALPAAAATAALLMSAGPASAAPVTGAPTTGAVRITPSLVVGLSMEGDCTTTGEPKPVAVLAMQRINWMWAPIALDGAPIASEGPWGTPLAKVLIPNTINPTHEGMRQRHDLQAGEAITAPGPKPLNPTTCVLTGIFEDEPFEVTITGVVVTIPKWLDALQPPIPAPPTPIQQPK